MLSLAKVRPQLGPFPASAWLKRFHAGRGAASLSPRVRFGVHWVRQPLIFAARTPRVVGRCGVTLSVGRAIVASTSLRISGPLRLRPVPPWHPCDHLRVPARILSVAEGQGTVRAPVFVLTIALTLTASLLLDVSRGGGVICDETVMSQTQGRRTLQTSSSQFLFLQKSSQNGFKSDINISYNTIG